MKTPVDPKDRCLKNVYSQGSFHSHRCTKPVYKDGWCKIHHPDAVKARNEKSDAHYQEQFEKSPYGRLLSLRERYNALKEAASDVRSLCIYGQNWTDDVSQAALERLDAELKKGGSE